MTCTISSSTSSKRLVDKCGTDNENLPNVLDGIHHVALR